MIRFCKILLSFFLLLNVKVGVSQCYLKLSSKFDQVLAIDSDSTLWTWGGSHGNQRRYSAPFQIDTNQNWSDIATGEFFAMAVKSDGSLWGWGNNLYGELGTGNTSNISNIQRVTSDSDWVKVSCGKEFTVALKSNGSVWAWGRNDNGQLGQGTNRSLKSSPVRVGTDSNFIAVSAGRYQTLLLKSDGTLWHFGAAYSSSIVSEITQVGTTSDWKTMAAGSFECYVIKQNGTLWEFVNNSGRPSGLTQVGTDKDWDKVDNSNTYSPEFHTLFIKSDSTLWALGDNMFGQLGTGDLVESNTPIQVGTASNWVLAIAGKHSSFGLKGDDTFWAWGRNNHAQFGNGLNKNSLQPINTLDRWKKVSASRGTISGHVLAIKENGSLWSWGQNNNGELGNGSQYVREALPIKVGTDTNWQNVSTGYHFSVAQKKNGTLWGFGRNGKGQLAMGSVLTSILSPTQIGSDSNWRAVSAGLEFTIALKENGTLWGWGSNSDGQLGNGNSGFSAKEYAPIQIGSDSNWNAIATGDYHTIALKNDSTLWSWGADDKGQLGRSGNRLFPMLVDSTKKFTKIACGEKHTLVLDVDSTLWVCGYNNLAQLGDSTQTNRTELIQYDSSSKWIAISAGIWHSLGIKSDSTLWGWGSNSYGQLGDSTTYVTYPPWLYVPTLLSPEKWTGVTGGNYATLGINTNGHVFSMGERYRTTFQTNFPVLGYTQTIPLKIDICSKCTPTSDSLNESICKGDSLFFGGRMLSIAGTYYDTLSGSLGCDSAITLQLSVTAIDDSISYVGGVISSLDSNANYQWLDCNNSYSVLMGDTFQIFTPVSSGSYAVELSKNGCLDTSECQTAIIVSLSEERFFNQVRLFPSPTTSDFQLQFPTAVDANITILNIHGQQIEHHIIRGEQMKVISLAALPNGVYFVKIENDKEATLFKVIKK